MSFFFPSGANRNRGGLWYARVCLYADACTTGAQLKLKAQFPISHCNCACGNPNAIGPNAIYDAHHSYHALDSNIMSLGYPGIQSTALNQGLVPHFASRPYLAGTVDGIAPLDNYVTDTAYGAASVAYDTTSAAYGINTAAYGTNTAAHATTSAAYSAGIDLGDLTQGIWPSPDPVSILMGYDHGAPDLNPSVYPPFPSPTLAQDTITAVQAEHNSAVPNTDTSRPRCPTCNTTFKRASDLARHEKKHQPDRPFKCLVPGCSFKGAYRKDKLDAHVKSCHRGGVA